MLTNSIYQLMARPANVLSTEKQERIEASNWKETLNPETLNPETLNPETLNPETLNPETLNPERLG